MQNYEFVAVPRQPFTTVEEDPVFKTPTSVTMVGQMVSHIRFERCSGLAAYELYKRHNQLHVTSAVL
jgi:hypothetical protein